MGGVLFFLGGGVLNLLFLAGSDFHLILIFYGNLSCDKFHFSDFPSWGGLLELGGGG